MERKLYLVRDRFGEKPLYYGWVGGDFLFASELKAMTAHPRFDNEFNREALAALTSRGLCAGAAVDLPAYLQATSSKYTEVGCDAPAFPLDESPGEDASGGPTRLRRYWSYRDVLEQGMRDPITDKDDAVAELEKALVRSIQGQSFADVPVGAFLSGGIDSSTIVALYQKHSSVPVRSFTIGFGNSDFNEAGYARAVAKHLGNS